MQFPAIELLFYACVTGVAYAYLGYPLIIWVLSRLFGRVAIPGASNGTPMVSMLVAAHNEQQVIGKWISNALTVDYPRDRLEIVVASDGSSDETAQIVRSHADHGVRLLDYPDRRGKAAVLNSAMRELTGEIVILSDANTDVDTLAIRHLVRWFDDDAVGAVCGRLRLTDPATGRNVESLYWKYETFLKHCEAPLDALLGANGALYAIRRPLYVPIPDDTIVDDFVIPLLVRLRHGRRIQYDDDAIAREMTPPDIASEFRRRSRIGAGGFQSIGLLWPLLNPRCGWIAFAFLSHKVLRWLCPFLLIGALIASALLSGRVLFRAALIVQIVFYLISLLAMLIPANVPALKALRLTTLFTSMNASLLIGFFKWLFGKQKATWERTTRASELEPSGT